MRGNEKIKARKHNGPIKEDKAPSDAFYQVWFGK